MHASLFAHETSVLKERDGPISLTPRRRTSHGQGGYPDGHKPGCACGIKEGGNVDSQVVSVALAVRP